MELDDALQVGTSSAITEARANGNMWMMGMERNSDAPFSMWNNNTYVRSADLRLDGSSSSSSGRGASNNLEPYFGMRDMGLFSSSLPAVFHKKMDLSGSIGQSDIEEVGNALQGGFLEEMESQAIGSLLPDDEDELLAGIMDGMDALGLDSEEVDVFSSGGGMEMDGDAHEGFGIYMVGQRGVGNHPLSHASTVAYQASNGPVSVTGEHPFGEHPSRTLFVRNINSNVEDSELRTLFEQYGDIRSLYTACKHRGFVMISYYDIRAARSAMRALQNKPLRRRKLDIHFSIPKDNPSDKDVNQGTLVVFNLDASVTNDDLRQIFGAYGEIKEIRETPHKRHHKFIEFYDVRAAESALRGLNRSDIAGKRIKLEPSRPGGARRSSMQVVSQEPDQEETRLHRQPGTSPIASSPPGHPPLLWGPIGSPADNGSMHGSGAGAVFHGVPLNLLGVPSTVSPASTSHHIGTIGGHLGHDSPAVGIPNGGSVPRMNSGSGRVGSISTGRQFFWGSPSPHPHSAQSSSPTMWSTLNSSSYTEPQFYGYSGSQGHFLNTAIPPSRYHHSVGSAPPGEPSFLDRHFGHLEESPDTPFLGPGSYNGFRSSHILGGGLNGVLTNSTTATTTTTTTTTTIAGGGVSSPTFGGGLRIVSPRQRGYLFHPTLSSLEGLYERGRARRIESYVSQVESSSNNNKHYQLDLDRITRGEDTRTTLMIKNIPNKYTSKLLLAAIDEKHHGTYDFLYLPIDFKNKCNVGYAFINMTSPSFIIPFYEALNGKKWEKFNSEKVASLAYARIQGKLALVAHFQNSSLMNEDKRCHPILFHTQGAEAGDLEPLTSEGEPT